MEWTLTLEVGGDNLPTFSARVTRTGYRHWNADYFRDGELIGNGLIGATHDDFPIGVVQFSLESYRREAAYWRANPSGAPDRP